MKKILYAGLIVIVAVLVFAVPVSASSGVPQETAPSMDLSTFLKWLVGGPGSIMVISWLFERMGWFQKLTPDNKNYTIWGAAAVVGCAALAVVTYAPIAFLEKIAPFFAVLSSTFVLVFVAKSFHQVDKTENPKYTTYSGE